MWQAASCTTICAQRAMPQVNVTLGDANHDPRLVRSIRIMETHIDTPFSIAAIARRVSMSARGLEQLFSRQLGQTPGAYFLSLRLAAARRLVNDTRLSMTDIASRTGFSSESSFSRAFSRQFGLSPRASRKQPSTAFQKVAGQPPLTGTLASSQRNASTRIPVRIM
jgi:transcriptional regulator GlxA family with amidase domain